MKVTVDWSLCDGNGLCVRAAPEMFALDDDDQLIVLMETFDDALLPKAEAAVDACPKCALSISADT